MKIDDYIARLDEPPPLAELRKLTGLADGSGGHNRGAGRGPMDTARRRLSALRNVRLIEAYCGVELNLRKASWPATLARLGRYTEADWIALRASGLAALPEADPIGRTRRKTGEE